MSFQENIKLKHIFILTNILEQGGAEKQSVLLAKSLMKHFPVTLIVYYGNVTDESLISLANNYKINVIYLQGTHINKGIQLYRLFRAHENVGIFSYLATSNMMNSIVGSLAGVKFKVGGIRSSNLDFWKMIIQRFLHNYVLSASVFNNYAGLKTLSQKGFNSKKSYVVHNCIDVMEKIEKIENSEATIHILSVGRFVVAKDYYTAIKSIKELKQGLKDKKVKFNYYIIGFGDLENDIRLWIKHFELTKEIKIVINPPNVNDYFRQADIYLSTSIFEGLSNSIMEAMEFSLPVVATNVGDNKYLVQEGNTGYLTPIKDIDTLSNRLKKLVLSKGLRNKMGLLAFQHLKQNFTEKVFTEKHLLLIDNLIRPNKKY